MFDFKVTCDRVKEYGEDYVRISISNRSFNQTTIVRILTLYDLTHKNISDYVWEELRRKFELELNK